MAPIPLFLTRDARILHLMRKGDEQALVMLYHDVKAMVLSHVVRNGGSEDDAEDLLQEALIVVWERVRNGTYEQSAKLTTFVVGIVKNLWLRRLARKKREPGLPDEDDPPSEDPSALDELIGNEEMDLLRKALEQIGELCRSLLLLFYWEERPMEEIASTLGFANAATAKSKKYQCKKQLERVLNSLMEHE